MYNELVKRLRDAAEMSEALAVLLPHSEGNASAKLYKEAADAIEELSKSRWIPVMERLPEENGRYLVVLKRYGFVDDIKLNDEEIRILRYHDGWRLPCHIPKWINETLKQEVTYWMPLPMLPKEE